MNRMVMLVLFLIAMGILIEIAGNDTVALYGRGLILIVLLGAGLDWLRRRVSSGKSSG
ncbi:hypothetical protein ABZ319_03290 [Nocardia sp. NPDC005978]|uniref:hypothetical protein n=1 Tax=Nocardia sp. NPDC005978 TaxID=3156725 RepID=UPI00339FE473